MNLAITTSCNLSCKYCFGKRHVTAKIPTEISLEDFLYFIRFAYPANQQNRHLSIFGGEPTTHSAFQELISITKTHNLTCTLFSNALFNTDIRDFLQDERSLDFCWNINSPQACGAGYKIITENIAAIDPQRSRLGFNIYSVDQDISYVTDILATASAPFQGIRIGIAHPISFSTGANQNQYVAPGQYPAVGEKIHGFVKELRDSGYAGSISIDCGVVPCMWTASQLDYLVKTAKISSSRCHGGPIGVYPDLHIGFCPSRNDSILTLSLRDLPNPQKIDELFNVINHVTKEYLNKYQLYPFKNCPTCIYQNNCDYGCFGEKNILIEERLAELQTVNDPSNREAIAELLFTASRFDETRQHLNSIKPYSQENLILIENIVNYFK